MLSSERTADKPFCSRSVDCSRTTVSTRLTTVVMVDGVHGSVDELSTLAVMSIARATVAESPDYRNTQARKWSILVTRGSPEMHAFH